MLGNLPRTTSSESRKWFEQSTILNHIPQSHVYVCAKSLQSCPSLCYPMDCSPPGSSVHGILQGRIVEWVAIPPSRDLLDPGIEPASLMSPALAGRFFTTSAIWEARKVT